MSRIFLHRLHHPELITPRYATQNCLFSLAAQRPDLYDLRSDMRPFALESTLHRPSALILRQVGNLEALLEVFLRLPSVVALVEAGIPFILDNSTEAGLCTSEQWDQFRSFLESLGLRNLQMLVIQQQAFSGDLCKACFHGHPTLNVQALVFHHWLHRMVMAFRAMDWESLRLARRLYPSSRRYLCMNGRLRSHRAIVVGRLMARGLCSNGLISMHPYAADQSHDPGHGDNGESDRQRKLINQWRQKMPGWEEELETYFTIMNAGLQIDGDLQHPVDFGGAAPSLLPHIHRRCKFSLVVETEMSKGELLRFTEKSLRPLAQFHPVLIAGNPGSLKLLRSVGFQTFEPWINESYDREPNPSARLNLVLGEAERLIRMPSEQFENLLDEMAPILDHNHHNFETGLEMLMNQQHHELHRTIGAMWALKAVQGQGI